MPHKLQNWFFRKIHSQNLVYNTCWEDPRCDRALLQLDAQSKIVMITSAGCNALAYALDQPQHIYCIDVNPRQNALLELKKAIIQHTDFETLFHFFGQGQHPEYQTIYREKVRPQLDLESQTYWDKCIRYFKTKGLRKGFYHYGTSGTVAWFMGLYLKLKKQLHNDIKQLLNAVSLTEQQRIYAKIETQFFTPFFEWLVNQHFTMCLLGVPKSQQQLFMSTYEHGAMGFIQNALNRVFTQIPVEDNYFYRVYVDGHYAEDCCPAYLKKTNFEVLQTQVQNIKTHTTTISNFLKAKPHPYSHYVLLDHQDWLAEHQPEALAEEWDLILKNSQPGTKILLRSAAENVGFFPDFVMQKVAFEQKETIEQHQLDRVGTYASVYLGIVK